MRVCCAIIVSCLLLPAIVMADEAPRIEEFVVRFKPFSVQSSVPEAAARLQHALTLSRYTGRALAHVRILKNRSHIIRTDSNLTRAGAWALATRMTQQREVEFAQPVDPDFERVVPAHPPGR